MNLFTPCGCKQDNECCGISILTLLRVWFKETHSNFTPGRFKGTQPNFIPGRFKGTHPNFTPGRFKGTQPNFTPGRLKWTHPNFTPGRLKGTHILTLLRVGLKGLIS